MPDTPLLIPTLLGLYAAILSTILGIHELRRGRPRVKVTASHGYIYDAAGSPSEPVILMEATNAGSGVIALNGVGWLNRDGSRQHIVTPYPRGVLPMDLHERRKCTTAYACRWFREIAEPHKILGVYFQDQMGKKWTTKLTRKQKRVFVASTGDGWLLE